MNNISKQFTLKNILMGVTFFLVTITSVVVVTQIIGFNLPLALLFTGISTILFHIITKNLLATIVGVSGLYVPSILYISQVYGKEYALGGVIGAGVMYLIYGIIMVKYQDKFMQIIPKYLLSTVIILIGLNLIPIGVSLVESNIVVGLISMSVMLIVELFGGKKIRLFSMAIGIIVGTFAQYLFYGLDLAPLSQQLSIEVMSPKFNLSAFLTISLVSLAVVFETLGDSKNIGEISKVDIFKEIGLGRIFIANGIASILGGLVGTAPFTTYSEQNSAVQITEYRNPWAEIFSGVFFIILAFSTPLIKYLLVIPSAAFGGVVLFLFSTICISAIKQIVDSKINFDKDKNAFIIMGTMLAISFIDFVFCGISISSIALATFAGIVLNVILGKREDYQRKIANKKRVANIRSVSTNKLGKKKI